MGIRDRMSIELQHWGWIEESARHFTHVANRIGLLAPELPEANDPTATFIPDGKGWLLDNESTGTKGPVVWTAPGGLVMIQRIEPGELIPEDARQFAHNILAAADYAETNNKETI